MENEENVKDHAGVHQQKEKPSSSASNSKQLNVSPGPSVEQDSSQANPNMNDDVAAGRSSLSSSSGKNIAPPSGDPADVGGQHTNDSHNSRPPFNSQNSKCSDMSKNKEDQGAKNGNKNPDFGSGPGAVTKNGNKNADFGSGPADDKQDKAANGGSKPTASARLNKEQINDFPEPSGVQASPPQELQSSNDGDGTRDSSDSNSSGNITAPSGSPVNERDQHTNNSNNREPSLNSQKSCLDDKRANGGPSGAKANNQGTHSSNKKPDKYKREDTASNCGNENYDSGSGNTDGIRVDSQEKLERSVMMKNKAAAGQPDQDTDSSSKDQDKYEMTYDTKDDTTSNQAKHNISVRPKTQPASSGVPSILLKIVLVTPTNELSSKPKLEQFGMATLQFLMIEKIDELKKKLKDMNLGDVTIKKSSDLNKYEVRLKTSEELEIKKLDKTVMSVLGEMAKQVLEQDILIEDINLKKSEELQNLKVLSAKERKSVHIYHAYDENNHCLRIITVGVRPEVDNVYREVKELLYPQIITDEISLGTCSAECFERLGYLEILKETYPFLQFDIERRTASVLVKGNKDHFQSCRNHIQQFLTPIYKDEIEIPPEYLKLCQKQTVIDCVYKYFRDEEVSAYFELEIIRGIVKIFSKSKEDVKKAIILLQGFFKTEDVMVEDPRFSALNSGEVIEYLESHKDEVYVQEKTDKVIIYATNDAMIEISKLVVQQLRKLKDEHDNSRETREFAVKSRQLPLFVKYLCKDKSFFEAFASKCTKIDGVSLDTHEGADPVILIKVPPTEMSKCINQIEKIMETIPRYDVEFSGEFVQLFNLPGVQQYIAECIQLSADCFWYTDSKIKEGNIVVAIRAKTTEIASRCGEIVRNCVQKKMINFTKDRITKEEVYKVVKKYQDRATIHDVNEPMCSIVCTSDIIDNIEKDIQEAVERRCTPTDEAKAYCFCTITEKVDFLVTNMIQQVKTIETKYHVKINRSKPYELTVEGYKDDEIRNAFAAIEKLCSEIETSCVFVPCNLMYAQSFKKDQDHMAKMVEQKKCMLKLERRRPQVVTHLCKWKKQFHLVVVQGSPTDIEADVVICPTNQSLFPFQNTDDLLKYDNEMLEKGIETGDAKIHSVGDMVLTYASPVYNCRTIAFTVFRHTESIKTNPDNAVLSIQSVLQKVLEDLDQNGVRSVSIPMSIIDDVDAVKQLDLVWSAIRSCINKFSSILEIYLCFAEEFYLSSVCKYVRENIPKGFTAIDLSPMFDELIQDTKSNININVVTGSLVHHKAEMLVNTCDPTLDLSKGIVSSSILKKAGNKIQEECKKKYANGINFCGVAITSGGNMEHCRAICHGALLPWTRKAKFSLQGMKIFIWQCLKEADDKKCASIAFPALGTGKLEYPYQDVAETMLDTIAEYGAKNHGTQIRNADIVVFDKSAVEVFNSVARKKFSLAVEQKAVCKRDWNSIPQYILEDKIFIPNGNTCIGIQVLPLLPNISLGTQMEVRQNPATCADYKIQLLDDVHTMLVPKHRSWEQMAIDCLLSCENLKLSSISFVVEGQNDHEIEAIVRKIKNAVQTENQQPYLTLVRIYIKDKQQFDVYMAVVEHQIQKHMAGSEKSGFKGLWKKTTAFLTGQKDISWRKKCYVENNEKSVISITGATNSVFTLKKELISYVRVACDLLELPGGASGKSQIKDTYTVWLQIDEETKNQVRLASDICKRLDFGVLKKEPKVKIVVDGKIWTFNIKRKTCYDENKTKIYGLVPEESSVDLMKSTEGLEQDPVEVVHYTVHPDLKKPQYRSKLINVLDGKKIDYNKETLEITGTFDQMVSLNNEIINDFGIETGIFSAEGRKSVFQPSVTKNPAPKSYHGNDFTEIVTVEMKYIDYKMLQFYSPDCQIFKGTYSYKEGKLSHYLQSGETEEDLRQIIKSKLSHLNSFASFEVVGDSTINESKMDEIKNEVATIDQDIFCYFSNDCKTITLRGNQYEKLQHAKTRTEFILGLRQQGQGMRKGRVFSTTPNYQVTEKQQADRPSNQTTSKSKSSWSQSFTGYTGLPTMKAPDEMCFQTPEGLVVRVYVGNILNLNVDCIVNAANETLSHGGGVADVISRAAGGGFQIESDKYVQDHGPLNVAECCTTSAGNLNYKCVIHVVGPRWYKYEDKKACAYDLKRAIVNCFTEAEVQNCTSVALPAISSAIFGVPKDVCSMQYCQGVLEYSYKSGKTTCLKEIHFMDKDQDMVQNIQKEFSQHLKMSQSSQSSMANANMVSNRSPNGGWSRDSNGRLMRSLSNDPDDIKHNHLAVQKDDFSSSVKDSTKFYKQYIAGKKMKISIVQEDITNMKVDIIVCPQDEFGLSKGRIAKAIGKVCNESYRNNVTGMRTINKCEVRKIQASPSSLPFKAVLHTVAPRWDKNAVKDKHKFINDLEVTIRNILNHCRDSKGISTVAIPVLGVGADDLDTPYVTYASTMSKEICKALKSEKFSLHEIYIVTYEWSMASSIADQFDKVPEFTKVTSFQRSRKGQNKDRDGNNSDNIRNSGNTTENSSASKPGKDKLGTTIKGGNLDNCVICMDTPTDPRKLQCGHIFCQECIEQHFKINNPVCPTCGSIQGVITGNQPPGTMKINKKNISLAGYPDCGRIEIEYEIYSGKQGPEHKTPGHWFEGITRVCYLPDNAKGQLVAKMLRVAFDRKLVFTIGDSRTTGKQGVVTWNDIHHKTNPKPYSEFGYPDQTYLDRVIDELSAKGVTAKDVGAHIRL